MVLKNATVFDGVEIGRRRSIVIEAGVISYSGPDKSFDSRSTTVIDCSGMFVSPSFNDSHVHLLGYAARSLGTDLSNLEFRNITQFIDELRYIKINENDQKWIRFYGYDDSKLIGSKPLCRLDLDKVFPTRPVIINFSSGHEIIINSRGLEILGITESTDEPPGVTFDRDIENGLLTGVILEGNSYIERYIPKLDEKSLEKSLRDSFCDFLRLGITSVTDATENNDSSRLNFIANQLDRSGHPIKVEFMPGFNMIGELGNAQITYGSFSNGLSVGPVKIMLSSSSGNLRPDINLLHEMVNECHVKGFPVAIHAVSEEEIDLALLAFSRSHIVGDRIEHASETRDDQIEKIASVGLWLSTQPGFIYQRGDGYISRLKKSYLSRLYRIRSFLEKGIKVGGSSDTPVIMPDPVKSIYSCVTRKTKNGRLINQNESLSITEALKLFTTANSSISASSSESSRLHIGHPLDIVMLNKDISVCSEDSLLETEVVATLRNNELVFVEDRDLFRSFYQ